MHERAKQRWGQFVALHSLRMPLHPDHPVLVRLMLDGFNHTVGGDSGGAQAAAQIADGLVVRSIDLDVERATLIRVARNGRKLSDFATGLDSRRMDGVRRVRRETFFAVLNLSVQLAGYVLVERATEANVKTLAAIANGENRFSGGESVFQDGEIGLFAVRVSGVCLFVARGAVKGRIHIGGSAGEDEGVQIPDLCSEFVWRKLERHVDGLGLGGGDRGEVILKLVRDGVGLFMRSAPGDAHTGAGGGAQLGISRGHEHQIVAFGEEGGNPGKVSVGLDNIRVGAARLSLS